MKYLLISLLQICSALLIIICAGSFNGFLSVYVDDVAMPRDTKWRRCALILFDLFGHIYVIIEKTAL